MYSPLGKWYSLLERKTTLQYARIGASFALHQFSKNLLISLLMLPLNESLTAS